MWQRNMIKISTGRVKAEVCDLMSVHYVPLCFYASFLQTNGGMLVNTTSDEGKNLNFHIFSYLIHERDAVAEVVIYTRGLQEWHDQIVSSGLQPRFHLLRLDQ